MNSAAVPVPVPIMTMQGFFDQYWWALLIVAAVIVLLMRGYTFTDLFPKSKPKLKPVRPLREVAAPAPLVAQFPLQSPVQAESLAAAVSALASMPAPNPALDFIEAQVKEMEGKIAAKEQQRLTETLAKFQKMNAELTG